MSFSDTLFSTPTLVNSLVSLVIGIVLTILGPRLINLVSSVVPRWRRWRIEVLSDKMSMPDNEVFQTALRETLISGFIMLVCYVMAAIASVTAANSVAMANLTLLTTKMPDVVRLANKSIDTAGDEMTTANRFLMLGSLFFGILYVDSRPLSPTSRRSRGKRIERALAKLKAKQPQSIVVDNSEVAIVDKPISDS